MRGNVVMKDKVEVLNAFFPSVFISNANRSEAPLVEIWS